jgi:hypothetical protein
MNLFQASQILGGICGAVGAVLLCHGHGIALAAIAAFLGGAIGMFAGPLVVLAGFVVGMCIQEGPAEAWRLLREGFGRRGR